MTKRKLYKRWPASRGPRTFKPVPFARVIRDVRDASRDYFIPLGEARKKFESGELAMDLVNQCFIEK